MISVVLATYNGNKYILPQLESLAKQTRQADELIIMDDESQDSTVSIALDFIQNHELSNWRVITNRKNVGYCENFYLGLDEAKGDYIFFCDQDDVWDADKIEVTIAEMEKHPELLMLSTRYRLINANGEEDPSLTVPHFSNKFDGSMEKVTVEKLIGHSYIRGCSLCIKKEIKEQVKHIELKDLLGHDWLVSMLAALKDGAAILNKPLMSYRCHANNASFSKKPIRRIEKRISGLEQSIEGHEYILSLCSDFAQRESIEKFIRFEKKRIAFLKSRNIFILFGLLPYLKQYSRYYNGNGFKVWLGDFVYAYKR